MREIKFDAIYKPTGEHFTPINTNFNDNTVSGNFYKKENNWCHFSLDGKFGDAILRQYTGLKDKNDTEIYEGDIVRVIHEVGYETVGQVEWGLSSKWFGTYPAFAIAELESEMNSFAEIFDTGRYTIEVIGNTFEHPHLLEGDSNV